MEQGVVAMKVPVAALVDMAMCWLESRVRAARLIPMTMPVRFVEVPSELEGSSQFVIEVPLPGRSGEKWAIREIILPRAYLLWSMMPYRVFVGDDGVTGYIGIQEVK